LGVLISLRSNDYCFAASLCRHKKHHKQMCMLIKFKILYSKWKIEDTYSTFNMDLMRGMEYGICLKFRCKITARGSHKVGEVQFFIIFLFKALF
jgi:hypothetical protein